MSHEDVLNNLKTYMTPKQMKLTIENSNTHGISWDHKWIIVVR